MEPVTIKSVPRQNCPKKMYLGSM